MDEFRGVAIPRARNKRRKLEREGEKYTSPSIALPGFAVRGTSRGIVFLFIRDSQRDEDIYISDADFFPPRFFFVFVLYEPHPFARTWRRFFKNHSGWDIFFFFFCFFHERRNFFLCTIVSKKIDERGVRGICIPYIHIAQQILFIKPLNCARRCKHTAASSAEVYTLSTRWKRLIRTSV